MRDVVLEWLEKTLGDRAGLFFETPEGYPDIQLDDDEVVLEEPTEMPGGGLRRVTVRYGTLADHIVERTENPGRLRGVGARRALEVVPSDLTHLRYLLHKVV